MLVCLTNIEMQQLTRGSKCDKSIRHLLIYATAPVKKVVAEVEILGVITGTPEEVWNATNEASGIAKSDYDKYFLKNNTANAYVLGKISIFDTPKELSAYDIASAPQSFVYVNDVS